jgi:biotin-(acetyl-CoA carboxylase) ligase
MPADMTLVDISFPPLLRGEAVQPGVDPFGHAVARAVMGCDPGLVVHNEGGDTLRIALVLAPEAPLVDAMAMVFAVGIGFSDALGALAPPEVGVHLTWPDGIRVNGARCGRLRAAASTTDPTAEPDWLVVGLEVAVTRREGQEPGADPDVTALAEEGCADIDPFRILESWSRHTLVWINHWLDEGMPRLHAVWRAKAFDLGEEVDFELAGARRRGLFVGIDEKGGMLLRDGTTTRLIPLTDMLET